MYSLADKYLITSLKDLASHRFLEALDGPSLSRERLETFISALEIIYSSSNRADDVSHDELESVIRWNRATLSRNKSFTDLIRLGGSFAEDVVQTFMGCRD